MKMRRADLISCTFWLVISLIMLRESYLLDIGTFRAPEAGFLPFVASIALGGLSFIYLISTMGLKAKCSEKKEELIFDRQTWPKLLKILYVATSLFFYSILLETLGFILDTLIFIGFLLIIAERQRWYVVVTGAISSSLFAFLLFDVILKCKLPKGFLGF